MEQLGNERELQYQPVGLCREGSVCQVCGAAHHCLPGCAQGCWLSCHMELGAPCVLLLPSSPVLLQVPPEGPLSGTSAWSLFCHVGKTQAGHVQKGSDRAWLG